MIRKLRYAFGVLRLWIPLLLLCFFIASLVFMGEKASEIRTLKKHDQSYLFVPDLAAAISTSVQALVAQPFSLPVASVLQALRQAQAQASDLQVSAPGLTQAISKISVASNVQQIYVALSLACSDFPNLIAAGSLEARDYRGTAQVGAILSSSEGLSSLASYGGLASLLPASTISPSSVVTGLGDTDVLAWHNTQLGMYHLPGALYPATLVATMLDILQNNVAVQNVSVTASVFNGIQSETSAHVAAVSYLLDTSRDLLQSAVDSQRRTAFAQLGLYIACVVVTLTSLIATVLLSWQYHRFLLERSVIELDFETHERRVKVSKESLRLVDRISERLGVLSSHVPRSDCPRQIELQILRAVGPLGLLNPFLPSFAFARKGLTKIESFSRDINETELEPVRSLELSEGLSRSTQSCLMFVGLHAFSEPDADLEGINTILHVVHRAVGHFRGRIVQVTTAGMLIIFSRSVVADREEHSEDKLEDGEELALHCAFAIKQLLDSTDCSEDLRPYLRPSIAVMSGMSLQGIVHTHVSKFYSVVGPIVSQLLEVERLNDQLNTSILCNSRTNELLSETFLTRPVATAPQPIGTVFEVVLEEPEENVPERELIVKEQQKTRMQMQQWTQIFFKYEAARESGTSDKLEEVYRDLENYRTFYLGTQRDASYEAVVQYVRRSLLELGVTVGTVDDEL